MWGVEKAADQTTPENVVETMGVIGQLPMEFQALYVRRALRNPSLEATKDRQCLTDWVMREGGVR